MGAMLRTHLLLKRNVVLTFEAWKTLRFQDDFVSLELTRVGLAGKWIHRSWQVEIVK